LLLLSLPLQPVDRSSMAVPPLRIFEGMLRLAEAGDLERMRLSLDLLAPVLAEHERVLGAERAEGSALAQASDAAEALRGVRRLVARDVVVLLRGLQDAPTDRARTRLLTASLEWRLLEPVVMRVDARAAQGISARLRDLGEAIAQSDRAAVSSVVDRLEAELRKAVP
jgi:hypothetical protein